MREQIKNCPQCRRTRFRSPRLAPRAPKGIPKSFPSEPGYTCTMNSNRNVKLIPVLRRPRSQWQIPDLKATELLVEQQKNEARAKAFAHGTTPYGREIFRRLLDLAWRRVDEKKSALEAIQEVQEELAKFPELHSEFVLMLSRTVQEDREALGLSSTPEDDPRELEGTSPWGWATVMVLRARLAQKLNDQGAGSASGIGRTRC